MGKSWKSRAHLNTGYPYNPIRAAHLQVIRPKLRSQEEDTLLLGLYGEGRPVFSTTDLESATPNLKRLEFLRVYSEYYATKIAAIYQHSRARLPSSCLAGLNTVEARVSSLSAPFVQGLQNSSERLLWTLDTKVDAVLRAADAAMHPTGSPDEKQALAAAGGQESRQAYVQRFEEAVAFVRENGVTGSARQALVAILRRLDETKEASAGPEVLPLLNNVSDAWERLAAYPPVHRLLEQAQPSIEFTQRKYTNTHDAIVASAIYHRAVGTAAEALQRVTENSLFKAAVERLYPTIAGIADPALEKLASSGYAHAVIEHWKPVTPEGEAACAVQCMPC